MKGICATYAHAASMLLLIVMPRPVHGAEASRPTAATVRPRPLSDDDLANLIAFTRAFGLLRFFHPSGQAASAPWDELAVKGVEEVERARSSSELARGLQALFEPVAPSARFQLAGQPVRRLTPPAKASRIVRWRHQGFGFGQRPGLAQIYFSAREQRSASPRPAGWAAPTDPVPFDLGRGVALALPVVVWADADGETLPKPRSRSRPPSIAASASSVAGTADRSARLAAVVEAWTAVRHFFPYFEETAVAWDEQLATALGRAATDRTKGDFLVTLRRMMAALQDGHAGAYLDEAPPRTAPPVALTIVDGEAVVARAWGEAAAAPPPGSVLLAIDGEGAATRMARTAAVVSASTPGWRCLRGQGDPHRRSRHHPAAPRARERVGGQPARRWPRRACRPASR